MRWLVVILILSFVVPAWAEKKMVKVGQSAPQKTPVSESDQWNQKVCPNGIEDWKALTTLNPYDSKGRCFSYQGGLVQMINKNKGLFSFVSGRDPFAMIDFGKNSVPVTYYSGVVLSKGAYSYQPVMGDQSHIFSFVSVPKSEERLVWENRKATEKIKEEEKQIEDRRAKAEQEWMSKIEDSSNAELSASSLILKDPPTGLMWARNGNIAEKRMDWKEAAEWAKTLNYAGYTDWRLPTKEEFEKLPLPLNLWVAGGKN